MGDIPSAASEDLFLIPVPRTAQYHQSKLLTAPFICFYKNINTFWYLVVLTDCLVEKLFFFIVIFQQQQKLSKAFWHNLFSCTFFEQTSLKNKLLYRKKPLNHTEAKNI